MKWLLSALGAVLILAGSYLASRIQTADGVRVEDIRFAGTGGIEMSALLYVPANASAASPAPGILAVHGLINSREMQDGFAIEFARRGYVVLALDMTGHGYSAPPPSPTSGAVPMGSRTCEALPSSTKTISDLKAIALAARPYSQQRWPCRTDTSR